MSVIAALMAFGDYQRKNPMKAIPWLMKMKGRSKSP